ncbi:Tyrosine-sulfated glycopeptide receptor 1 [Zea mays]|uniref:Tyrosine-sulfated glycopeptide receptor 1 n=1 Tax=Zea mays TaxID=4577 RepID=A0A1D6ERI2_MAIZE|nr:Tyrosine-sulfated glycopeptide receptor 1 [Zea mays]
MKPPPHSSRNSRTASRLATPPPFGPALVIIVLSLLASLARPCSERDKASLLQFHGQLSERIGNLKSLTFLSLVNNSISNITGALQTLGRCSSLTTLFIGHNFLNEAMPDDDRIDGFQKLQVLALNHCSLSGKIPSWLSKLTNLEVLLLYGNQLTGSVPGWINSLKFLFHINLSNNSLVGEIPTALVDMPMLKADKVEPKAFELPVYKSQQRQFRMPISFSTTLNLGMNNFIGVIPEEIGQLKALLTLYLSYNDFTGPIPQSICNLTNLESLDLSSNHLTGAIPTALNNLHFLSKFNVSDNDLEGPIPTTGQLSTFPSSSFEGNPKLCGPMLARHCGSAEALVSTKQTEDKVLKPPVMRPYFFPNPTNFLAIKSTTYLAGASDPLRQLSAAAATACACAQPRIAVSPRIACLVAWFEVRLRLGHGLGRYGAE